MASCRRRTARCGALYLTKRSASSSAASTVSSKLLCLSASPIAFGPNGLLRNRTRGSLSHPHSRPSSPSQRQQLALFDARLDLPDVREILKRVAAEDEEARLVAGLQVADLALGEDGRRRRLAPHLEQRQVVEDPEPVQAQRFGHGGLAEAVAPDGDGDAVSMQQPQVACEHLAHGGAQLRRRY